MTKLGIAKLVISVASGIGVSKVTNDIITSNTTVDSTEDRIKVLIGSTVLGCMVGEMASNYVVAKVDSVASFWQNRKTTNLPIEVVEDLADNAA